MTPKATAQDRIGLRRDQQGKRLLAPFSDPVQQLSLLDLMDRASSQATGEVVHACHPVTWEVENEELEFRTSLGYRASA